MSISPLRTSFLAVAALLSACTTNGEDASSQTKDGPVEASSIPEVTDIPTEEAALQEAQAEIDEANADEVYEALLEEIESELAENP